MGIDTSIYGQLKPAQIDGPMDAYAKVAQFQQMQQQNKLAELMFAEKQREVGESNAISDLYKSAVGADGKLDRTTLLTKAAQGGLGKHIPTMQKTFSEQDKATADLEKTRWDATSKKLDIAGQAFGYVRSNPTLEAANQVLDYLGANGVYDGDTVTKYKQMVAANPAAIKQLADQAFISVLDAKSQLPSFQTRNTGGTTDTLETNPVTGTVKVVNSVKNTQSPESVASVAATIRGQNMSDARAKEANDINRGLVGQKLQLEVDEKQSKADERKRAKEASVASVANQIGVIDKALKHPGRKTSTGLSGSIDPRNYIAGTDASDFRAVLDQIGGTAFLQAFESLKGGGQITEVEGKKATDAIARLSRAQSDKEFEQSLNDLRSVMNDGYKRLAGQAYQAPGAQKPAAPNGAVMKVTSAADYAKVPSGATYVTPDGVTRRKP